MYSYNSLFTPHKECKRIHTTRQVFFLYHIACMHASINCSGRSSYVCLCKCILVVYLVFVCFFFYCSFYNDDYLYVSRCIWLFISFCLLVCFCLHACMIVFIICMRTYNSYNNNNKTNSRK